MMLFSNKKLATVLVLFAVASFAVVVDASDVEEEKVYCPCTFTADAEDEPDCRVYGQLGDKQLIPWYRANQDCLDTYNIKVAALDRENVIKMCPNADGTDANTNLLFNEMKNVGGPATRAIQATLTQFFVEDTNKAGSYVFLDTIQNTRNSDVDCTISESTCWSTVKEYFNLNPTIAETACKEFRNRLAYEQELEQSTVRIRLCQEGSSASAMCEPLAGQVNNVKTDNPNKFCSAFGLGPAGAKLPVFEGCVVSENGTSAAATTLSLWGPFLSTMMMMLLATTTTTMALAIF